jgi:hypothetical protein
MGQASERKDVQAELTGVGCISMFVSANCGSNPSDDDEEEQRQEHPKQRGGHILPSELILDRCMGVSRGGKQWCVSEREKRGEKPRRDEQREDENGWSHVFP